MTRTWRTRALRGLAVAAAVGTAAIAACVSYLLLADLGRHRQLIARLAAEATGFHLEVDELHVDLALWGPSRIDARGLRLTNPTVTAAPELVSLDHLRAAVELWPLLDRRLHVRELTLDGARAAVAVDAGGRLNWSPPKRTTAATRGPRRPLHIVLDQAVVTNAAAAIAAPPLPRAIAVTVNRAAVATDAADNVTLDLAGSCNELPLDLDVTAGSLTGLLTAGAASADVKLAIGTATATVHGHADRLAGLVGLAATIDVTGPDVAQLTGAFGLPSVGDGEFLVDAELAAGRGATRVDLEARLGNVVASLHGELDSLTAPQRADAAVAAAGPDLAAAGALFGADHLPAEPFEVAGQLAWAGSSLELEDVVARVGANHLTVDGTLGAPPALAGSELTIDGAGPDAGAIGALFGLRLPAAPYRITGGLQDSPIGVAVDDLVVTIGDARLRVAGELARTADLSGSRLAVNAAAASLARFTPLAGVDLPPLQLEVTTEIAVRTGGLEVERAEVRLGRASGSLSGLVTTAPGLVGSRVRLAASGADLSELAWAVVRLTDTTPPQAPFEISGELALERAAARLTAVRASVGDLEAVVDGRIGLREAAGEMALAVAASGADLGWPLAVVGLARGGGVPFRAAADLELHDRLLTARGVHATVGETTLDGDAEVPLTGRLDGARARLSAAGPRLSDLTALGAPTGLPPAPFDLACEAAVADGFLHLAPLTATVDGDIRVTLDGVVATTAGLVGSDIALGLAGEDLDRLRGLLAGFAELAPLPAEPYTLEGHIAVAGDGVEIPRLAVTLGAAHATVTGRVGPRPELYGTDLVLDAAGPSLAVVSALTGVAVTETPFAIRGRVVRKLAGTEFGAVSVRLGEYLLDLDGRLGPRPRFVGSDLRVNAEGPDLGLLAEVVGLPALPHTAFRLSGHAAGSQAQLQVDELALRLGASDVAGNLRLAFDERPRLEVELSSDLVDLTAMRREPDAADAAQSTAKPAGATVRTRVFPDTPVALAILDRLDAHGSWRINRLQLPTTTVSALEIGLDLVDGRFSLGPFRAVGDGGGVLAGELLITPDATGHHLAAAVRLTGAHAVLSAHPTAVDHRPSTLDLELRLAATGATPHQLAASSNGRFLLSAAGGDIDGSLVDFIGGPLLMSLAAALSPFRDKGPSTVGLECAVVLAEITDGILVLDPFAAKSERVTVLGHGGVDLASEKLSLEWVVKPRKGLGLSASTITNPYVKLGGTLAAPSIDVKPIEALASTGVAVATGGLSLLGKGLWDRVTSGRDLCGKGLEKARRRFSGEE